MPDTEQEVPFRILPRVTDRNRHFWTGGEHGELRFLRCQGCGYYLHPPTPVCPRCHSKDLEPEAVSGKATLWTYTVNHQNWMPGPELPYVVAIVELPEQEGLRLTTNLLDVDPDTSGSGNGHEVWTLEQPRRKVEIGMALEVTFEQHEDVWIPLFRAASS